MLTIVCEATEEFTTMLGVDLPLSCVVKASHLLRIYVSHINSELNNNYQTLVGRNEMELINAKVRTPKKEDSPILAWGYIPWSYNGCANLFWMDGWNGEGWYDYTEENVMKIEEIEYWLPLPLPPKE